ncbi:hypothetical protein [Desulfoferrobacter suflitae]|uniref:hypothetical protein n=1 Tax=Desulfoferrobacter suflitae TaxID=2865782 RepID=UPI002164AC6A|nr:hypothetical protein [Desulfoferrobacter suflitae]MCK8600105.1 hypothetical protein [Desulfoferrobacter suflitae]
MSFSKRSSEYRNIIDQITEEYKEAAFWLPFDALTIKEIFSLEELERLKILIDDMESATNENEQRAKLVEKIDIYGDVVVKALKLAKIIV